MARTSDRRIEHLLRRAGFGARPDELSFYGEMSLTQAVDALAQLRERRRRRRQLRSGKPGYVGTTARGPFAPQSNIVDARQRWLFRMVHSDRPLQEKMTLFWHNHFATGYSKIAGALGAAEGDALHGGEAVRGSRPGARPDRDAARQRARQLPRHPGQHRQGHGDARLARRPDQHHGRSRRRTSAARSWSCSRWASATSPRPTCTPAARVFTGWNLARPGVAADGTPALRVRLQRRPARHRREDVQLSDLRRRQQDDSGARGRRRHAGRPRSHRRAGRQSEHGALPGAASCTGSSSREFGAVNDVVRRPRSRRVYLQSRYDMKAGDARGAAVAGVLGPERRTSRATPGRWNSSSAR